MLFQTQYVWFVLMAAMDTMMTWIVLFLGGQEVNYIADRVIISKGLPGLLVYKFALVIFVVILCECVGRRSRESGHRLAEWAVAISAIPVIIAFVQLIFWAVR